MELAQLLRKKSGYNDRNNYHIELVYKKILPRKIKKLFFSEKVEPMTWIFFINILTLKEVQEKVIDKGLNDFNFPEIVKIVSDINEMVKKNKSQIYLNSQNYYIAKKNMIKFLRDVNIKSFKKYLRNLETYGIIEPTKSDKKFKINHVENMKFNYRIRIPNRNDKEFELDKIKVIVYR